MRRTLRSRPLALVGAVVALCLGATVAQAQIDYVPCGKSNELACAKLAVPLDPSGAAPGTVTLSLRRHRAPVGEAKSAIIALAGGPGQPAIPFTEDFLELLGPIAATRDLIVFDQRGIGKSQPLSCHAFERLTISSSPGPRVGECAAELGASRAFYTSADTVADIEAIRQAGGYEKLVLYGTSYGTKVAEEYAQRYPQHVEALVLDSVVPPAGPDTLNRPTFAAIPRVLREICAASACKGVTREPVADLSRVLALMRHGVLRVHGIAPSGRSRPVPLSAQTLLSVLLAGDFSQPLRADFVTALAAAARGDREPLARMLLMLASGESEEEGEDFDLPLYYATTCEEQSFPWRRSSSPTARIREALAAATALPHGDFAPFDATDAIGLSDIPACAYWPYAGEAAAAAPMALPAVPTLILSGADDARTPTSGAREVQSEIPGSHLLVVPHVGHSVLGEDTTSCSSQALQALFASRPIKSCGQPRTPVRDRPESLPPLHLSQVRAEHGYRGRAGRTAGAIELTLGDLATQAALALESGAFSASGVQIGGLRGGWARLSATKLTFHDYSYVPGVTISGALRVETAQLHITGSAAAAGTLALGANRKLHGQLEGISVQLSASPGPGAAIVGSDAAASSAFSSGNRARRADAGVLAGELDRLFEP